MPISIAPGVFDILPNNPSQTWGNSHLWDHVESIIREMAQSYGFREIRTPIFERTELFSRGVGESSDIVSKEMYTFLDKGGRSMSLRPEGTAPAMRAYIENQLHTQSPIQKIFYIGPMFRYERTQAGRYRQHHQFGAEVIGNSSPEQDAELIDLIYSLYQKLGLKNLNVYINSIGNTSERLAFKQALKEYLHKHFDQLSEESKLRYETNPLRILDSKDAKDRAITAKAPSILEFLEEESLTHFETLKTLLTQLQIPYQINQNLVRGLDYYNNTVFEITAGDLGAQNSVGGGGRYDGLLKTLEGPDLPAIGFGTGLERIIQTMIKQEVPLPQSPRPTIFIVPLGAEAKKVCFKLTHDLRQNGVSAEMDFSGRKLNKVMQYANTINAQFVAVVGDEELKTQTVELKEMSTGLKTAAPLFHLARILRIESSSHTFINLWTDFTKPFETQEEANFFISRLGSIITQTQRLSEDLLSAMEKMKGIL